MTRQSVIAVGTFAFASSILFMQPAKPQSSQQPAMMRCNSAAEAKELRGDARKKFMSECMPAEVTQIDKQEQATAAGEQELNSTYSVARSTLRDRGHARLETSLVNAQRGWVKFRERHCDFEVARQVRDLWDPHLRNRCQQGEAIQRVRYLEQLLK